MSYHAWTLRRAKPHIPQDTIYTLKKNTANARHSSTSAAVQDCKRRYIKWASFTFTFNMGTVMQNTQSKTQDRQTCSYLRLTRQSCRCHGHYTVHTTNMPRWHPLPASKTLKPYILLPLSLLSIYLSLLYKFPPLRPA